MTLQSRSNPNLTSGPSLRISLLTLLAAVILVPGAGAETYGDPDPALDQGSYTYVRTLEGSATLVQGDTGQRDSLELNQPVLAGDRIWVPPGSRLELVLSDRNLLRLDGGTEVLFERLAHSPDREDRSTVLRLLAGDLQMVVVADALAGEAPRVETANASIYAQEPGTYRIGGDRTAWSWVTVRDGYAEVVTDRGSLLVRSGEEAQVEGDDWPRATVRVARGEDPLERWGYRLSEQADRLAEGYVDGDLSYAAAPLEDHGEWLLVEGRRAWRPYVTVGWRPYYYGRWAYTPSGLLWVSSEPWGWVPYHYGTWSYHPAHNWIWYPGSVFAPAWVYWYWGPSHVAWVPTGYYSYYYGPHYAHGPFYGFHHGIYGHAGGPYHHFRHWVFCSLDHFHHHDLHHYAHGGDDFHHRTRRDVVPHGVITTDTRGLTRADLLHPETIARDLPNRSPGTRFAHTRGGEELPDVTPFVAREPTLPETLERRLVARTPDAERGIEGTPLSPGTVRRAGREAPKAVTVRPVAGSPAADGRPTASRPGADRPEPSLRARTPSSPERAPTTLRSERLNEPRPSTVRPTRPDPSSGRTPTSVRPQSTSPPRPSTVRPARPAPSSGRTPTSVRPQSTSPPRPSTVRPTRPDPSSGRTPTSVRPQSTSPPRPSTVRPARPDPSSGRTPTSVRPQSTSPPRPSTVRPAQPAPSSGRTPTSVKPQSTSPPRPSTVRPVRPAPSSGRTPTSVRPQSTSPPRPSTVRPAQPSAPARPSVRSSPSGSRPSAVRPSPGSTVRRPSVGASNLGSARQPTRVSPRSPSSGRSVSPSGRSQVGSSSGSQSGGGRSVSGSSRGSSGGRSGGKARSARPRGGTGGGG